MNVYRLGQSDSEIDTQRYSLRGCKLCVDGTYGRFISAAKSPLLDVLRAFSFVFRLLARPLERFSEVSGAPWDVAGAAWPADLLAGSAAVARLLGYSFDELDVFDDEYLR